MYLDVCNAASMLWRLEMYGVDIGNRWKDLTEVSLRHVDDHDLVFVSLHYLMALLKGGETAAAARLASQMERYAEAATTQGRVSGRGGVRTAHEAHGTPRGDAGGRDDALLRCPCRGEGRGGDK